MDNLIEKIKGMSNMIMTPEFLISFIVLMVFFFFVCAALHTKNNKKAKPDN